MSSSVTRSRPPSGTAPTHSARPPCPSWPGQPCPGAAAPDPGLAAHFPRVVRRIRANHPPERTFRGRSGRRRGWRPRSGTGRGPLAGRGGIAGGLAAGPRATVGDMPDPQRARRERIQLALAALGADAALITSPANVRYLTGLASSNAALLLPAAPASGPVLATDSRYAGTAQETCPDLDILIERSVEPALARVAAGLGIRRLAFEAHEMTVERYRACAGAGPGTELVPLGRAVEEIRRAKDEQEIALLARACEITSRAFEQVVPLIRPGVTERGLAIALERAMTDLGADGLAFDTIVASGPNGAIPHHVPS